MTTPLVQLIADLKLRFKSGNSVPVERAHITATEFATIAEALAGRGEPTDDVILEIRDGLLPSQGESFDTLAFGRACYQAALASQETLVQKAIRIAKAAGPWDGVTFNEELSGAVRAIVATPSLAGGGEVGEEMAALYYMRDNHTFRKLDNHAPTALTQIEQEFNSGYTHGMLCSNRPGFVSVHANGNKERMTFLAECEAALKDALHGAGARGGEND